MGGEEAAANFGSHDVCSGLCCAGSRLLAPRALVDSLKRLKTMVGRKVEAAPPLRAFEQALTDDVIATLVDRGFAVVDNALPAALCRKLRGEMEALEANGQMWNSRSYGGDDDGAPHAHINETQLDYKQVRLHAPTFGRMEHDPSLVERMRACPDWRLSLRSTCAFRSTQGTAAATRCTRIWGPAQPRIPGRHSASPRSSTSTKTGSRATAESCASSPSLIRPS